MGSVWVSENGVLKTGLLLCSSVLVSYKLYSKEEANLSGVQKFDKGIAVETCDQI